MAAPPPPPPPRRTAPVSASSSRPETPENSTWSSRFKTKGGAWGKKAVDKSVGWSDSIGARVNNIAEKRFGTEHFYPVTGDFSHEMDKAARILRSFTVDGVETQVQDGDKKRKTKVIRKIPPSVISQAKGMAIFTSMRSGMAPFGGAGGAGVVVAKLPDGTWSAPASISPNSLTTGLIFGIDVYDCVLIIRNQAALDSFATHKATLGADIGVTAGPFGAGAAVEAGKERAPVFSYVKSRGLYAGVQLVGQVFVERFEENAAMYHWPGVKAGDILSGKVRVPVEAANLQQALKDAESGKAQRQKGDALDIFVDGGIELQEGEVLKLPPTPDATDGTEWESDPETERIRHASSALPPPPLPRRPGAIQHHSSTSHYSSEDLAEAIPTTLVLDHGSRPVEEREAAAPEDLPAYSEGEAGHGFGADDKVAPADSKIAQLEARGAAGGSAGAGSLEAGGLYAGLQGETADAETGMSESERREWEQHLAMEKEAEAQAKAQAKEAQANGIGTSTSTSTSANHDESLR